MTHPLPYLVRQQRGQIQDEWADRGNSPFDIVLGPDDAEVRESHWYRTGVAIWREIGIPDYEFVDDSLVYIEQQQQTVMMRTEHSMIF